MTSVAIFTECYQPIRNGVVVSIATFSGELKKLGFQVSIFAPKYPGYRDSEPGIFRLPSVRFPIEALYPQPIPYWPKLNADLETAQPDLIHTQSPFLMGRLGAAAARKRGIPLVFTYHTLIERYTHYAPLPQQMLKRLMVKISRDYSNKVDCVVTPSQAAQEILLGYGVTNRIEVIPTGIDMTLTERDKLTPIRHTWDIPQDAPLLIYTGRLAKEKNIEFLLQVFALLRPEFSDAHFLLVGGGPWQEVLQEYAQALGIASQVRFSGYLPRQDVLRCCAEADVYLFASQTETQGICVLEAMAVGVPCVAVRASGVSEAIDSGENGFLTELDHNEFAEKVRSLLRDPDLRRQIGARAREKAAEFSSQRCALKLANLYQELLGGRKP